jgi:hypothetical protein
MRKWIVSISVLVLIPGIFSAWWIFQEESFRKRANLFIKKEFQSQDSVVVGTEMSFHWQEPKLRVQLMGEALSEAQLHLIQSNLEKYGLTPEMLEIRQSSLAEKIEQRIKSGLSSEQERFQQVNLQNASLELQLNNFRRIEKLSEEMSAELGVLFPGIQKVLVVGESEAAFSIFVLWKSIPRASEITRVDRFLKMRSKQPEIQPRHLRFLGSASSG